LSTYVAPFEKLEIFVDPGAHTIEVRRPGFKRTEKKIQAEAGSKRDLELEPPSVPEMKTGPTRPVGIPAGEVTPSIMLDPALQQRRKAILIAGLSVGGAGVLVGTATAIVASTKGSAADRKHDEIESAGDPLACAKAEFRSQCNELLNLRREHDIMANIAIWSFIGASVVAGGTAAYYVLTAPPAASKPSQGEPKASSISFAVMPLGVIVNGAW
jgi:hypothetical protein